MKRLREEAGYRLDTSAHVADLQLDPQQLYRNFFGIGASRIDGQGLAVRGYRAGAVVRTLLIEIADLHPEGEALLVILENVRHAFERSDTAANITQREVGVGKRPPGGNQLRVGRGFAQEFLKKGYRGSVLVDHQQAPPFPDFGCQFRVGICRALVDELIGLLVASKAIKRPGESHHHGVVIAVALKPRLEQLHHLAEPLPLVENERQAKRDGPHLFSG